MRIRSIKPEFWRDPDSTGRWSADLKLFYVGMWQVADDQGRFAWDPELIAADLFPYDRGADVVGLLEQLREKGRAVSYIIDRRKYGYLPKFLKHQKINRPTLSRFPPPPEEISNGSVSTHGGLTEDSLPDQVSGISEQRISEQGCCGEPEKLAAPPSSKRPRKSPEKSSRHPLVIALWCQLWKDLRGGDDYQVSGGKDGTAVTRLLKNPGATDLEIDTRIRRYLADPWNQQNGGLAHFVSKWSNLDGAGRNGVAHGVIPAASREQFGREGTHGF